ncbi:MAG: GMC family oxidoreductase, partial [Anaerolineae bacterium]|nr:GMC family oxidoreductase [Anaerolineae bacterium]
MPDSVPAPAPSPVEMYDYVIIGSGFGGSVSAMRLAEKGYTVRVLERGRRYRDLDFPKTTWEVSRYIWLPILRLFGMLELTLLRHVLVLRWSGVGGGSLGFGNVLMEPPDEMFDNPGWGHLADWRTVLRPHYETARRMLGVATNPRLWPSDHRVHEVITEQGGKENLRAAEVSVFFGEPGVTVPDPFFGGEGPERAGCTHCGGCMVGCRHNAKNTLPKNYLYFAEKRGAAITPDARVEDIRALPAGQPDGARYAVHYRHSRRLFPRLQMLRARNVIVSAGTLGTLDLLFTCRDQRRSLPNLSPRLGERVRTNNESLIGSVSWDRSVDYSQGVAITSLMQLDPVTYVEP